MSDQGPGGLLPLGASTGLIDGVSASFTDFSQLYKALSELQAATPAEVADVVRTWGAAEAIGAGPAAGTLLRLGANDLASAIEEGSVLPDEARAALEWAQRRLGVPGFTRSMLTDGRVATALTLWGLNHGRIPETVSADTAMTQFKPSPKSRTIHVAGVSHETARAISLTAAAQWTDVLELVRGVTAELTSEVRAVGVVASQALAEAKGTNAALASHVASTEVALRRLAREEKAAEAELAKLVHAKPTLTMAKILQRVETYITHHVPTGIAQTLAGLKATQHVDQQRLDNTQHEILRVGGTVTELVPLLALRPMLALQPMLQKLPTTLKTLQDCCYENSQVTGPIRAGGATPSLLHNLGSLLGRVGSFFFLASMLDALVSLLDMPAAIFATVQSAEWIAGYAVQATSAVTANLDLAGLVAGVAQ